MYPIQHTEKTLTQTQKIGENDDEIHVQEKHDSKIVYDETKNEEWPHEDNEPISERLRRKESKHEERIFEEYCTWKSNHAPPKIKF